jgi:hypothetical protein
MSSSRSPRLTSQTFPTKFPPDRPCTRAPACEPGTFDVTTPPAASQTDKGPLTLIAYANSPGDGSPNLTDVIPERLALWMQIWCLQARCRSSG